MQHDMTTEHVPLLQHFWAGLGLVLLLNSLHYGLGCYQFSTILRMDVNPSRLRDLDYVTGSLTVSRMTRTRPE